MPAKGGKEEERRVKREANMQRGMQLLREGNASGAHQFFSKAADVTPLMAHNLIQVCFYEYSGATVYADCGIPVIHTHM